MAEVLLELKCSIDGSNHISNKCVLLEKFEALKQSFNDKSIDFKLETSPYKDVFTDVNFIHKIKVITDPNKISAFKTLYGDSFSNELNLLNLIFIIHENPEPIKVFYDSEEENNEVDENQQIISNIESMLDELTSIKNNLGNYDSEEISEEEITDEEDD